MGQPASAGGAMQGARVTRAAAWAALLAAPVAAAATEAVDPLLFPWAASTASRLGSGRRGHLGQARISLLQTPGGDEAGDRSQEAYKDIALLASHAGAEGLDDPAKALAESAELHERDRQLMEEVGSLHQRLETMKDGEAELRERLRRQDATLGALRAQADQSGASARSAQQLAQATARCLEASALGGAAAALALCGWLLGLCAGLPWPGGRGGAPAAKGDRGWSGAGAGCGEPCPQGGAEPREKEAAAAREAPGAHDRPRSRPPRQPRTLDRPPGLPTPAGAVQSAAGPAARPSPEAISAAVAARAGVRLPSPSAGGCSRSSSLSTSRCEFFNLAEEPAAGDPAAAEAEEDWWGGDGAVAAADEQRRHPAAYPAGAATPPLAGAEAA